jgi:cell shape-determining protein MreC
VLDGRELYKKYQKRLKAVEKENAELRKELDKYKKDTQDQIRLLAVKIDNIINTMPVETPVVKNRTRRIA